jgi:hypothetical protein
LEAETEQAIWGLFLIVLIDEKEQMSLAVGAGLRALDRVGWMHQGFSPRRVLVVFTTATNGEYLHPHCVNLPAFDLAGAEKEARYLISAGGGIETEASVSSNLDGCACGWVVRSCRTKSYGVVD